MTMSSENSQMKILIVEDEPDISDYLCETLEIAGYKVFQAYDGEEGYLKTVKERPNLALLDIMMPKLNGIDLCKKIRADSRVSATSIIFTTAKGDLEEKLSSFDAGADDFLVKPFSTSELLARIEAHLRIASLSQSLELSERKYKNLVEHSPDGIMLFSEDSNLVFANKMAKEILEENKIKFEIDAKIERLKQSSRFFSRIDLVIKKTLSTRQMVTASEGLLKYRDLPILLEIRAIPTESVSEKHPSIQIILRDVTERKNLEKMISRAEKINSLGILTAGIAHEINNPLAGISNAIHLLKKDSIKKEKKVEILELVDNNIGRISRIIEDLRVFSRQEKIQSGSFNLITTIDETTKLLRYQHASDKVSINFHHTGEKIVINGNKNQFQQIMINLLLNASQAISGEGQIDLVLKKETEKQLVKIEVSDNGCGIAPNQLDQIFDPFFTTKRDWHGTGLGLAVSYRLVQLLKGSISVKSVQGEGTTFYLSFPLADD